MLDAVDASLLLPRASPDYVSLRPTFPGSFTLPKKQFRFRIDKASAEKNDVLDFGAIAKDH